MSSPCTQQTHSTSPAIFIHLQSNTPSRVETHLPTAGVGLNTQEGRLGVNVSAEILTTSHPISVGDGGSGNQ